MRLVAVLAVLLLSAAPSHAQGSRKAEADIRSRMSAFETAWNRRDVAAMVAMYTDDADVIMTDAPVTNGRAAVQAEMARAMASVSSTKRIGLTPISIRFLGPDVAIVNTVAHFNEGAIAEDRGTWTWVRRKGKWMVAALRVLPAERQ